MTSSRDLVRQARASTAAGLPREVRRRQAVVTCMDARVDPWRLFDAGRGDIHVIRNAGGIITADVVRSLLVSQHRLGTTRIDVVMHTDCGMLGLHGTELASEIEAATGNSVDPGFGGFAELEPELVRGVSELRRLPALLSRNDIRGHIFDVATGRLHRAGG